MTEATETTFDTMGLSAPVLQAINDLGWNEPTPVQIQTFPLAIEGRDLIVQSRTGTGKTAAFGLPLVDTLIEETPGVQALVLAPTRELALQSAREIARLGAHRDLATAAVYGGAPMEKQVRELRDGAQIVSGTPGRVLDHLRRGTLDPSQLKVLVLDEADEILSMGFAKELHAIMELLPTNRQTLLFSATVDGPVQRVGERHMTKPAFVTLSGDAVGALGVSHFVYMVSGKGRVRDLTRILEVEDPESAIVFCNTKAETEAVAASLQQAGFQADWLNGDLPQSEREKVMARTRASELRFLVATDVAARGIDISHLTHVINFALPPHLEQYIHRTGRTGRAGRTGTALSLVAPAELGSLYYLRLQYKIFPVERSLPTAGEEATRLEADRVQMLAAAFVGETREIDRSVAKRLMTHPEAERIVCGLVSAFFGGRGESVDEEAAAARRERRPEQQPDRRPPEAQPPEPQPGEPNTATSQPPPMHQDRAPSRTDAVPEDESSTADDRHEPKGRRDDDGKRRDDETRDEVRLYVNLGRKDGVRVGDLNRLFQEQGGLERGEIGRIRLRDKHSFVHVPTDRAEAVIAALSGHDHGGRELKVEPAKS